MYGSTWRPDGSGLMLFELSTGDLSAARGATSRLSVDAEPESLANVRSVDEQSRRSLPLSRLYDAEAESYIKAETEGLQYASRSTSLDTLDASPERVMITPNDSNSACSPDLLQWEEVFDNQMKTYAANAPSSAHTISSSITSSPTLGGYGTDGTDFLPYAQTPCDRRVNNTRKPKGETRRFFMNKRATSVVRRLDWGRTVFKKRGAHHNLSRKTEHSLSLEQLRNIERSPPHKWTSHERELLCVLYRWFFNPFDSNAIPTLFNAITGLALRDSVVVNQFKGHILLYGGKAIPEFGFVFGCPFLRPSDRYRRLIELASKEAQAIGVELPKRYNEPHFVSGSAVRAKAKRTRAEYKRKVRVASQQSTPKGLGSLKSAQSMHMSTPGGISMTINQQADELEFWVDADQRSAVDIFEEVVAPGKPLGTPDLGTPSLAYRVWDRESRTVYSTARGFVANGHRSWNGTFLPPPDPSTEHGNNFLMFLTNQHLNIKGGDGSGFVSVSTSLVEVMQKAARMINPEIALISVNHPSLQEPRKKLSASLILSWLKKNGQALQANYKGSTELLIWSHISPDAIISRFHLSELEALVHKSEACAELLRLEEFLPHRTVPQVVAELRDKNIALQGDVMGQLARAFGLDGHAVALENIKDFVSSLVDGWHLQCDQMKDAHTMSTLAMSFATSLRSQSRIHLQDIMGAFVDGCQQGQKTIEFYARHRRMSFRRRKT